jgi:hypothetical protein
VRRVTLLLQLGGITTVSLSALENRCQPAALLPCCTCFLLALACFNRSAPGCRGIDRVLDAAADLHAKASSKQSTQQLNAWLDDWRRSHPPTPGRGTRLK